MRRIQANLSYLAGITDRLYKPAEKVPKRPYFLETLPVIPGNTMLETHLKALGDLYADLKPLFTDTGTVPNGASISTPTSAAAPAHGVRANG